MSLALVSSKQADQPEHSHPALHGMDDDGVGGDAIAIPCEHVLLARIKLPPAAVWQLQAATRSAVADLIADPVDEVHIVPGRELGQGEFLVAVLRHAVMEEWAPRADATNSRLVPDVLALPIPPTGSLFMREAGGRVLVRLADGTGFATGMLAFPTFWRAAGMPEIVLLGGQLQGEFPAIGVQSMPASPPQEALEFDLITDRYARKRGAWRTLKGVAAVVVLALIGHLALLGTETVLLGRIAEEQEALLRGEAIGPSAATQSPPWQGDPTAGWAATSGFLPFLSQVAGAFPAFGEGMAVRNMTFDADAGTLGILVEGPDLAALQGMEAQLDAAGLNVSAGAATSSGGTAEMRLIINRLINGQ
jgi:general secretion pathway protein L